jgi:hypothetical protein
MFLFTFFQCCNMCWVLAKLQLAPPRNGEGGDILPVGRTVETTIAMALTTTTTKETDRCLVVEIWLKK